MTTTNNPGFPAVSYPNSPSSPQRTLTASAQLGPNDAYVFGDTTAGAITATLPALSAIPSGHPITLENVGTSANPFTVAAHPGDGNAIEGVSASLVLEPGNATTLVRSSTSSSTFWRVVSSGSLLGVATSLAQVQVFSPAGVSQSDGGTFLDWDGDSAAPVVQVGAPYISLTGPNSSQMTLGELGAGWYRVKLRTKLNGPLTTTFAQRITTGAARTPIPGTTTTDQTQLGSDDLFMDSEAYVRLDTTDNPIVVQYFIDDGPEIFEVNFSAQRVEG
jgi:hypothetical protein